MIYLKSLAAGLLGALVALLVSILIALPRIRVDVGEGSGGIGAVSAPIVVSLPLIVLAFAGGFIWRFRRLRRRT